MLINVDTQAIIDGMSIGELELFVYKAQRRVSWLRSQSRNFTVDEAYLLKTGKKIKAIQLVRDRLNIGLVAAKSIVDYACL